MINVDISNVWTCVSLPELLGGERQIFDAHNLLRNNQPNGPDFHGWLGLSNNIHGRQIHSIRKTAEKICSNSDILLVCGSGSAYWGAEAAIDLYCGRDRNLLGHKPLVLFTGDNLSSRQWLSMSKLLEGKDYSLHIISADGIATGTNVAARGLRWMMERKYGTQAKSRISVATVVGSPLHRMGQEEGYELFPLPKEMGGTATVLTAAALLPMAVAGIDPLDVLEGAVEAYQELDVRAFENPAGLYAGARSILSAKGRNQELLCVSDPGLLTLAKWWQRHVWQVEGRQGQPIFSSAALIPGDLEVLDPMAVSGSGMFFETVIRMEDPVQKKVPVEMDWKDYDGLGFLSGRSLDQVEQQLMESLIEIHNFSGIPLLDLQIGELTPHALGSLFCFFELSAALTACTKGVTPFAPVTVQTQEAALTALGYNSSL